jgi:hypothetical protein
MKAADAKVTTMKKCVPAIAWLTLAVLSTSCVAYKIKEMGPKAVAAKGGKAEIVGVQTKTGYLEFRAEEPARVIDGAVVGKFHAAVEIDPYGIAEATRVKKRANVVMKDGARYEVLSSRLTGDRLDCEVLIPACIPLDEVRLAKVKVVNGAMTALSTIGGVVILPILLVEAFDDDEGLGHDLAEDIVYSVIDSAIDAALVPSGEPAPPRSVNALLALKESPKVAEEQKFWVMEWTPVDAAPDENGKLRVRLDNLSSVPRGVDEAKLVVVDHPVGVGVAPDSLGIIRAFSGLVAPARAVDRTGGDIAPLVGKKDDIFWRSPGGDSAPVAAANPRDELTFEFLRPAGASKAKLIVNAANTMWRAQFAREVLGRAGGAVPRSGAKPLYREGELTGLGVRLETVFGWQTGQVIFTGGPLPAEDAIYWLDLGDVKGTTVRLKLEPPVGYWLIDRLALDFGEDTPVDEILVDAEGVDSPDAAEVLRALAVEDGSTLFLEDPGSQSALTFTVPPPTEGMERTIFLRTVSCYEMPPRGGALPLPSRR